MNGRKSNCRRATHAGSWYSENPSSLDSQLNAWLANVPVTRNHSRAVIAPHAGYSYCGDCAAFAYKQIDPTKVKRVFILGPSHHVYLKTCALTSASSYQTPFYDLTIDRAVCQELQATGHFELMSMQTDEDEHSIEMHLPYIAKVMSSRQGQFTVVPVLVGSLSVDKEHLYGQVLAKHLADPENLFVISSDFCHWGKRFSYMHHDESKGQIFESIQSLDKMGMDLIEKLDSAGFSNYLKQYQNTICGRHPIGVFLCMIDAMKASGLDGRPMDFKFLYYSQSNHCRSKNDSSVSYAAGTLSIR